MANIKLERVNKIYPGGTRAVTDATFEIKDGEFCVFVGPSGCGKSTMLRMIAGLEEVTTGKLLIDGVLSNEILPKDREIAMVFQNYALYPHLNVFQNMAFGLQTQTRVNKRNRLDDNNAPIKEKYTKEDVKERVEEASKILGIEKLLSRKPGQLSGGEKQRVALGRALVRRPKIFLLDEPLSNVDAQIRSQMRTEIKALHQKLGITFIYVTHDQTEAMTMADKIIIMDKGEILQIGSPSELYHNPQSLFVATFIGTPGMNLFSAKLISDNGNLLIQPKGYEPFVFPQHRAYELCDANAFNSELICGIRPAKTSLSDKDGDLVGKVMIREFLGSETIYYSEIKEKDDLFITLEKGNYPAPKDANGLTHIHLDKNSLHLFLADSGKSILGLPSVIYLSGAKLSPNGFLSYQKSKVKTNLRKKLIDKENFNSDDVVLGLNPNFISEQPLEAAIAVKATVKHTCVQTGKKAVFLETNDQQNISFYDYENKNYQIGQEIVVYLPSAHIHLYEKPFGARLSAKEELFDNVLDLSNLQGLSLPKNTNTNLQYSLVLSPSIVSLKKKIGYSKALVLDNDILENKTVLYVKFNDQNYASFVLPGAVDRHNHPHIYIKVTSNDLILVK